MTHPTKCLRACKNIYQTVRFSVIHPTLYNQWCCDVFFSNCVLIFATTPRSWFDLLEFRRAWKTAFSSERPLTSFMFFYFFQSKMRPRFHDNESGESIFFALIFKKRFAFTMDVWKKCHDSTTISETLKSSRLVYDLMLPFFFFFLTMNSHTCT